MKIYFLSLLIVFLTFTISTSPVWAVNTAQITTIEQHLSTYPTLAPTIATKQLIQTQTRAATMISDRLTSLNTLLTRVTNDSRLSSIDKTSFTSDIQTILTNLQTLGIKIQADTNPITAITDTQSIVTTYHIYAIYEPKIRLLLIVNNLQTIEKKLSQLIPQLTSLTGTNPSSTLETALTDMSTKSQDMNTRLTRDKTILTGTSVKETIPTAQQNFTQAQNDLKTVQQDLLAIRSDLTTIRSGFKQNKATTGGQ